jgi:hypothetical protein
MATKLYTTIPNPVSAQIRHLRLLRDAALDDRDHDLACDLETEIEALERAYDERGRS